jgi:hypothetical protein
MIIPVRIQLTHQQFMESNPILRMANGTNVTLAMGDTNVGDVAKRITRAVRMASTQD